MEKRSILDSACKINLFETTIIVVLMFYAKRQLKINFSHFLPKKRCLWAHSFHKSWDAWWKWRHAKKWWCCCSCKLLLQTLILIQMEQLIELFFTLAGWDFRAIYAICAAGLWLGGHSHVCAFTSPCCPAHPNSQSKCFGAGGLGAWEISGWADQGRRWFPAHQPRWELVTQPSWTACWMPCRVCCCSTLISWSFSSARKKWTTKAGKFSVSLWFTDN